MRRFFTESCNIDISQNRLCIIEDAQHISKVLRMEPGDSVLVFDGSGYEYEAEITLISKERVLASIVSSKKSELEPNTMITLFQGIPKSGKFDIIVQKAVELGVYEVVPVSMDRSVAKITSDKKGQSKIDRFNKISKEAAKQCGRGLVPMVLMPITFSDMIHMLGDFDLSLMLYEELGHSGEKNLKSVLKSNPEAKNIAIIIGPEGGFSSKEADMVSSEDVFCIGLGKRILRTETAGSTALSIIMYEKDEI